MAGGGKTFKKIIDPKLMLERGNPIPHNKESAKASFITNPAQAVDETVDDAVDLFTPQIPEPGQQTIIPIPDESLAANEQQRRRARRSRTGRQSTRLTEGLGG